MRSVICVAAIVIMTGCVAENESSSLWEDKEEPSSAISTVAEPNPNDIDDLGNLNPWVQ